MQADTAAFMPPTEQARWFAEQIQPHEPALRAYLLARFPALGDHDDVVQETYARLLRAQATGDIRYAKAFLFTTARNAALDLFRRRRAQPVELIPDDRALALLDEPPGVADTVCQQQELDLLADAVRALPERCRQVVLLRYLDGLAYKEIAVQLGISPETVKVQMAKGMRRCAEFFAARGLIRAETPAREVAS